MTEGDQCLGEVRVYFFDHHGGDGPEQQIGSIIFPDFYVDPDGDTPGASSDEIAVRIWNAQCALSDLAFQGQCRAIVGSEAATPTSGHAGAQDPRFVPIWRAYDYLNGRLTNPDGTITMTPLDVDAYTSKLVLVRQPKVNGA